MRRLVIAGAKYYYGDMIVIPHFTGEFSAVDCDRYLNKGELKEYYSKDFIEENKEDFIEHEGEKYYYAEYSPFHVSEEWDLISDLSDLRFEE